MTVASQLKQTIFSLKGAQATMRLYAEQSGHDEARNAFRGAIITLDEILDGLEGRLRQVEYMEPQYKAL
jgi:hypothetical protein